MTTLSPYVADPAFLTGIIEETGVPDELVKPLVELSLAVANSDMTQFLMALNAIRKAADDANWLYGDER